MSFESKSNEVLLASTTDNMGTTFFSLPGNITNAIGYCIQAIWSSGSSPTGSMSLQASIDDQNWSDISNSTLSVSGDSGNNIFNASKNVFYNFVRLKYTRTSGDGILVVYMVSKG